MNEVAYFHSREVGNPYSLEPIFCIDPSYFGPTEVETLLSDLTKAKQKLNGVPEITLHEMCAEMVAYDPAQAKQNVFPKANGYQLSVIAELAMKITIAGLSCPALAAVFSVHRRKKWVGHQAGQFNKVNLHHQIQRSLVCRYFPNMSGVLHKDLTRPLCSLGTVLTAIRALVDVKSKPTLGMSIGWLIWVYAVIYARQAKFLSAYSPLKPVLRTTNVSRYSIENNK